MTIKIGLLSIFIMVVTSCNYTKNNALQSSDASDTTTYITNDTIPNFRKIINRNAVASFSKNVPDEFNKWVFAVDVYETKETFKYNMRIKYKELTVSDSLRIPNFGIMPKVILQSGKEPLSCIIGFTDKKGNFKEYRKAFIDNDRLRIVSLKSYFVAAYKTKMQ
ncbi:MAG: hypothetical protein QM541_10730 [Flavobacterium sp.]|nr:hypothetical protein [Flavobacterium sp.]